MSRFHGLSRQVKQAAARGEAAAEGQSMFQQNGLASHVPKITEVNSNSAWDMTLVAGQDTMQQVAEAIDMVTDPKQWQENPARALQTAVGAFMGVLSAPEDMFNSALAGATNAISAMLPDFPAATIGSLYMGLPHCHAHPPSLIPPNPVPIPLPSIGAVMLGTCVQVLINNMPAARAGDIGLAPTCVGFAPFFEIKTGSSKVFIGGMRAARMIDFALPCMPSVDPTRALSMAAALGGAALGVGMSALGAVADATEAVQASGKASAANSAADAAASAAQASAAAISAAANVAQAIADAAAAVATRAMGTDPAIPPAIATLGMVTMGAPNVLIGGVPMPNMFDIAMKLLNKLKRALSDHMRRRNNDDAGEGGPSQCEDC